jgi:hypothetical protein
VLWKNTWAPEAVLTLLGGILMSLFLGNIAVELLHRLGVAGFRSLDGAGSVLVATLCFHGAALVLGGIFLEFFCGGLIAALGLRHPHLRQHLRLTGIVLLVALPVMLGLKFISEIALHKIGWKFEDQRAVEMFGNIRSVGLRVYLGFFAVILAPLAEEFIFRGVLFSSLQKMGWPKCAWIFPSLLFALIHNNAPIFAPLFAFALALTWLYQKTGGLLAPMLAHALFNATNLGLLFLEK